jgi:aryl-alcohol dehydrogenase-like predicted oxidoreductase
MSQFYGAADDSQSIDTIRAALDLGVNFLDTSDVYGAADIRWGVTIRGFGHNEELIGTALAGRRDDVVLATNLRSNLQPVDSLVALAQEKGCRAGQLALAWLLAQPLDVVPIPGTRRAEYVQENVEATNVAISIDEIAYLSEVFARNRIIGERYAAVHAQTVEK